MRTIAIVTGGSRGIGAATARALARRGHAVCIAFARAEAQAARVVDTIRAEGGEALAVAADVSREDDVLDLFRRVDRLDGRLAILVNNAGVTGGFARVDAVRAEQIDAAFAVNVRGTVLCCREAIRRMSRAHGGTGGVVVNVSSTAARTGGSGEWVHYAASKAAVTTFTTGLAREVAAEGVRVVAVAPGLVHSDLHADNGDPGRPARLAPGVPMGRVGEPEEIAAAIAWAASPEASYCTGAVLEIGGGR